MPGQLGNAAIAGHRTTYGQPFNRLDELVPGDEITIVTLHGTFKYAVTEQLIVSRATSKSSTPPRKQRSPSPRVTRSTPPANGSWSRPGST
jgi:sortase A